MITIQNSKFNPDTINIMAGSTVTWTNNDSIPHTVVSDTGAFKNITINKGDNSQYIFYKEGTYNYHDSKNPSMTGKIIVTRSKGY
jgi:plastocyanin